MLYSLLFIAIFELLIIIFMSVSMKTNYNKYLRVAKCRDSLNIVIKSREKITDNIPISSPIHDFIITSSFGERIDPFVDSLIKKHDGIDILNIKNNDTVYCTASGEVLESRKSIDYGNMVKIKHPTGFSTLYAHMDTVFVCSGDFVKFDTPIGIIGSTGKSTGPHLHYEIIFNDENQNPNKIIEVNLKK